MLHAAQFRADGVLARDRKVQNAWGNAKDAGKEAARKNAADDGESTETEKEKEEDVRSRRKVS